MDDCENDEVNGNTKDILEQIGEDPFVKAAWIYTVAKFVIMAIGVLAMFIYCVVKNW